MKLETGLDSEKNMTKEINLFFFSPIEEMGKVER